MLSVYVSTNMDFRNLFNQYKTPPVAVPSANPLDRSLGMHRSGTTAAIPEI